VVKNHVDGTGPATADDGPMESPERDPPGVDSALANDGGAIFDNPKRGSPMSPHRAARAGQRRERRRQRSRGRSNPQLALCVRPRRMVLVVPMCAARAERSEGQGGQSRRQRATAFPGAFPTVGEPISRSIAAERTAAAATRGDGGNVSSLGSPSRSAGPTVVREAGRRQQCLARSL